MSRREFEPECPACGRLLDNHGSCWNCEETSPVQFNSDYVVRASLKADREVTVTLSLTYTTTLPHPMPVETQVELFNAVGKADLRAGLVAQIDALIQQAARA